MYTQNEMMNDFYYAQSKKNEEKIIKRERKRKKKVKAKIEIDFTTALNEFETLTGMSFDEFYLSKLSSLTKYISKYIKDEFEAEDIATECFLKSLESINLYDNTKGPITTWVYTIAKNLAYKFVQSRKKNNVVSLSTKIDEDGEVELSDVIHGSEEEDIIKKEYLDKNNQKMCVIMDAISMLKEPLKTVIELREIHGLSYEDISDLQNIPQGTTKSQIKKGRELIKEMVYDKLKEIDLI